MSIIFFLSFFRYLFSLELLLEKLFQYLQGSPLDPKVTAEIERVREGAAFYRPVVFRIPEPKIYELHQIPFLISSGMNVKSAAFIDSDNIFFEEESQKQKELLTAVPTVTNPYVYLPDALQKLLLKYHPARQCL
jgi:hypothetical protein